MRIREWSSDVGSSDLMAYPRHPNFLRDKLAEEVRLSIAVLAVLALLPLGISSPSWLGVLIVSMYFAMLRSEERRVGKDFVSTCISRGSPILEKKKNMIMRYHIQPSSTI